MKAYLSRRYGFCASHRLHAACLDAAANRTTYGKCNNPFGHGHNYVVELTFSGPIDAETGMVTNLADLDGFAREKMLARFDHQNLNMLEEFAEMVPTSENFAVLLHRIFTGYGLAKLERVHLEETENNSFDYSGE